jgi:hypothetical protein
VSLLWFSSLQYNGVNLLGDEFLLGATPSGWTLATQHPRDDWRKALTAVAGSTTLPIPVTNVSPLLTDAEICFFGFSLSSTFFPSGTTQLAVIKSSGAVAQLRIKVYTNPTTGDRRLEVWSGDLRSRFLISSYFDTLASPYIEIEAELNAVTGRIVIRIEGTIDSYVENINTVTAGSTSWHSVDLDVDITGGHNLTFADFYLASGLNGFVPPGRASVVRIWPWSTKIEGFQWGFDRSPRLVIMLGQSNMNGRGDNPPTTQARNPNGAVTIWNVEEQEFQFLEANVNTGSGFDAFLPSFGDLWGPEMMFAELAAQNHERTGQPNVSQTYIIKLAEDASWVSPLIGVPTWHPSILNNLSDTAINQINVAVAAAGGWVRFPEVDIFWHQGESEAVVSLFPSATRPYTTYTNEVFDHFEAQLSSTAVHWHRTVMHEDTLPAVFLGIDSVLAQQRSPSLRGSITETSDLGLQPDLIHLDIRGFDSLGRRYFQRWMERVLPVETTRILDAYFLPDVDTRHMAGVVGASMEATQLEIFKHDLIHSPGIALSNKLYALADAQVDTLTSGALALDAASGTKSYARFDGGSFTADGFSAGMTIVIAGFNLHPGNNGTKVIEQIIFGGSVLIVVDGTGMVNEPGSGDEEITYTTLVGASHVFQVAVGGISLPEVAVPPSLTYNLGFSLLEVNLSPETITGNLKHTAKR